jgi:hypothetical protein
MDMMNFVLQTYPVYYSSSILSIWHYAVPNWVDLPLYPGGTRTLMFQNWKFVWWSTLYLISRAFLFQALVLRQERTRDFNVVGSS